MNKQELTIKLEQGMQYLTEQEKLALLLTYYEDLNILEILKVMEIDEFSYQKLITNARTKMRVFTDIFDKIDQKGC